MNEKFLSGVSFEHPVSVNLAPLIFQLIILHVSHLSNITFNLTSAYCC